MRGLEPEFPAGVARQLAAIAGPGRDADPRIRDLTALPWCSIDNDDSLDLDQLTACEPLADGAVKDHRGGGRRRCAGQEGLGDRRARPHQHHLGLHLGTGVSDAARAAVDRPHVAEPRPGPARRRHRDGRRRRTASITQTGCHRAQVRNKAKLAYDAVSAWIDGAGALPDAAARRAGHGPAAAHPGRRRAAPARAAACTGFARARDLPAARGVRRRARGRHPAAGAEPRTPADRGVHDRDQRLHRPLPGRRWRCIVAPRGALARALAAHRRRGAQVRRGRCRRARFAGARSLSGQAPPGRPAALSRSVAGHRQADGLGRIRRRAAGAARRSATSAWRCATTRTPRRRTGASPT